jgi:hypothetical protein
VVLGSPEHVRLLAAVGDAVALQVSDMRGQRRRAESAASMADQPGLDDDAAFAAEQTATAERGTTSPEGRVAVPRAPFPPQRRPFDASLPHGAQHLVDDALVAASIADAPHHDLELIIVATHARHPRYLLSAVPHVAVDRSCSSVEVRRDEVIGVGGSEKKAEDGNNRSRQENIGIDESVVVRVAVTRAGARE